MAAVEAVLAEIGAAEVPQLVVWNKIDLTGGEPGVDRDAYGKISRVRLSARTGSGIELLRQALAECVVDTAVTVPGTDTQPLAAIQ